MKRTLHLFFLLFLLSPSFSNRPLSGKLAFFQAQKRDRAKEAKEREKEEKEREKLEDQEDFQPVNISFYLDEQRRQGGRGWGGERNLFRPGGEAFDGVALLFAPTFSPALPFVVDSFLKRLPTEYQVIVLTNPTQKDAKIKLVDMIGTVNKRWAWVLPVLRTEFTKNEYSCHLISSEFYEGIPSKKLLIFQQDSIILRGDDGGKDLQEGRWRYLRDFEKFSYIGAPWGTATSLCSEEELLGHQCFEGGNGGLSFRRTRDMAQLLAALPPSINIKKKNCSHEDRVIARVIKRELKKNGKSFLTIPEREFAGYFSAESVAVRPDALPWGVHKPWVYQPNFNHPEILLLKKLTHSLPELERWTTHEWKGKMNLDQLHRVARIAIGN